MSITRRYFTQGAGLLATALYTGCAPVILARKSNHQDHFGATLLIFEHLAGVPVLEEYHTYLNEVVDEAAAKTKQLSAPFPIVTTIDSVLRHHFRFLYRNEAETGLLSTALAKPKQGLDSHLASYLYISIAEERGLPLRVVLAPDYCFVRWHDSIQRFNWDVWEAVPFENEYYTRTLHIHPTGIENRTYLYGLTRKQALGIHLTTIAAQKEVLLDPKKICSTFATGINLNTHNPRGLNNAGLFYMSINSLNRALVCFKSAVNFDPWFTDAQDNLQKCSALMEKSQRLP